MNRVAPPPRCRVDELRLARGLKNADLARRAGIDPSTVHKIVSGKRLHPRERIAERLAEALGADPGTLFAKVGSPIFWLGDPRQIARLPNRSGPPPSEATLSRDVPVYGTAEAGPDGAFHLNNGEAIDWAKRPAGLIGVQGLFAIYAEGDSMVPWRDPGELVFVHENRHAAPGCHVIAELWERQPGHPPRAFLKKLVRRTATRVELEQYNPRKVIAFEKERVGRLYRVIEWAEVHGV